MEFSFINPNPETLPVHDIQRSETEMGLSYLQNAAVRRLIAIREKMATEAERERCLAACELSDHETNQLYSAETARYIETKIRKGQ